MKKRIIPLLLLVFFWSSAFDLLPRAKAAETMTASEACIEFIKSMEGFSAKPYYDYKQHTVGYGTKCPTDKYFDYLANGISKKEAEELLHAAVTEIEEAITKKMIDRYGLSFTQHQFDALVSFSFNLGTSWMSYDSSLRSAIVNKAGDDALVYAFGLYCTAGGVYSTGLIQRRLCEANMYLNGIYSKNPGSTYGYVFYEPNGGSLTYQVQGFIFGNDAPPAAEAVRTADVFTGWYTDVSGGTKVTALTKELSGKTLYAQWQSGETIPEEEVPSIVIAVTGDVVNIRKGPGTNYGIAAQVRQNDSLVVSHVTELAGRKWGKVQKGWICLEYTNYDTVISGNAEAEPTIPTEETTHPEKPTANTPVETESTTPQPEKQEQITGIVRVNDLLRIRSGPGTSHSTVGYLTNGTKVTILEEQTVETMVWGKITRGWVSMDYIQRDSQDIPQTKPTETIPTQETTPDTTVPEPTTQETSPIQTETTKEDSNPKVIPGIITADALRIRAGAGTDHKIVGFYYQNEEVIITETKEIDSVNWGKTRTGWINMDYVRTEASLPNDSSQPECRVMTVTGDCLRVRKEIGTDSRIAALLYYGDKVTVFETQTVDGTQWGRICNGWICMDYVK